MEIITRHPSPPTRAKRTKKPVLKVPATKEIQKFGRTTLPTEIKLKLNAALRKSYSPHLKDEFCLYKRLDEARLKKYGDYMCYDILRICKILRSKNKLFKQISPKTIAKVIKHNFELEREDKKFEEKQMITGLTLVDIGFLTFEINGEWMLERIEKNLKDGIVAWAPIATIKRAVVDFPVPDIDAEKHADGVRSNYIRDTLVRMLEYSGVQVSGRMGNDQALLTVKKHFREGQGFIRNKGESLFSTKEKSLPEAHSTNVHEDIAALWFGIYKQKTDWIVYVTPVRQRDYIMKCFSAAEGYYQVKDSHTLMSYLGYQTSDDEQANLIIVWSIYKSLLKVKFDSYVEKDMMAYGYSSEEVFECFIKYAYLKTHKYSECKLDVRSLAQENNFLHLLNARKEIRSVIKKSRSRDLFKLSKALVGKEREFGLHLLQFTEVIEKAFSTLMPHFLCDYLFKLCENFSSYNLEAQLSETWVLLCKAAEAVMEKGFDLLGITPKFSKALTSYLRPKTDEAMAIRHYTPYPVPRKNTSSRFELFSMFIEVTPSDSKMDFEKGQLFGHITVSDTCGLLKDGWLKLDRNGCGHVAHFVHDFDNSITIHDSCLLSFGNPGSPHAVAFSDSIKMGVHLYVTTDKNACYELCSTDYDIKLDDFWVGKKSVERNAFSVDGINGCVRIYYILIKEAVDTSWSLWYEPESTTFSVPKFDGNIVAYYGDDNDMSYHAVMFRFKGCKLEKGNLKLERSTLSVPANETLKIRAFLRDDSGNVIIDETRKYAVAKAGRIEWFMKGENYHFNLLVYVTVEGKSCN